MSSQVLQTAHLTRLVACLGLCGPDVAPSPYQAHAPTSPASTLLEEPLSAAGLLARARLLAALSPRWREVAGGCQLQATAQQWLHALLTQSHQVRDVV
jgi:hypothetical protein